MAIECKKDGLSQLQSGDWKLTLKIAAGEMPQAILNAAMGARYQTAFVEVDDTEQPIQHGLSEGERAKRHFEAMCQDEEFGNWFHGIWHQRYGCTGMGNVRQAVKAYIGIQSANELLTNPDPWHELFATFQYRNISQ